MPSNKRAPAPPAGRSLYDLFGDEGGPRGATSHHYRLSGPSCISLSGGRTSGFQLHEILDAHDGVLPADAHVVFANTGREHPNTLAFVHQIAMRWGVDVAWVEYDGHGGRTDFREVTFETASRDGGPFETLIGHKNALPNVAERWCTQILKVERIRAYMRSRGYEGWTDYVGLRADEPRRVSKRRAENDDEVTYAMPLASAGVTVSDVRRFWARQPFDLDIPNTDGNCTRCFEKRSGVLIEGLRREPESGDWYALMEARTRRRFSKNFTFAELRAIALVPPSQLTGRAKALAEDLGDDEGRVCACTD